MKTFYGSSFMKKEELSEAGIFYPIKLEYYRTWENTDMLSEWNSSKYGIEVMKTSYLENKTDVEIVEVKDITGEEKEINEILDLLRKYQVTPITAEHVIEDLIKGKIGIQDKIEL